MNFVSGKLSSYLSYRSWVWTKTDNQRCGILPFVFDDGFSFESYVDYLLKVPMYFVRRDGEYIDCAGSFFSDFMEGKLGVLPGRFPTMTDWMDHLTVAFPEVRLKKFIELRGADGGPISSVSHTEEESDTEYSGEDGDDLSDEEDSEANRYL